MEQLKFTQEIKDKWLEALKSGKYRQGFVKLYNESDNTFCCIGVLGDIHPNLISRELDFRGDPTKSPYKFLKNNGIDVDLIWQANDGIYQPKEVKDKQQEIRDYSNVIPLIEKLPVQS